MFERRHLLDSLEQSLIVGDARADVAICEDSIADQQNGDCDAGGCNGFEPKGGAALHSCRLPWGDITAPRFLASRSADIESPSRGSVRIVGRWAGDACGDESRDGGVATAEWDAMAAGALPSAEWRYP